MEICFSSDLDQQLDLTFHPRIAYIIPPHDLTLRQDGSTKWEQRSSRIRRSDNLK